MKRKNPDVDMILFRQGNPTCFRVVFDFYFPIIYRYIYSRCPITEDVEELSQEVFVQFFLLRDKINRLDEFYPLLFTIAKRLTISHFRKQISLKNTQDNALKNWREIDNSTEELIQFSELNVILDGIIRSLPDQQRKVYSLSYKENLDNQTIADQLGLTKNTVKNHLSVANKKVRLSLIKLYHTFL